MIQFWLKEIDVGWLFVTSYTNPVLNKRKIPRMIETSLSAVCVEKELLFFTIDEKTLDSNSKTDTAPTTPNHARKTSVTWYSLVVLNELAK
jgi:hypothetical protein